mgnify:CR=1 FL=1
MKKLILAAIACLSIFAVAYGHWWSGPSESFQEVEVEPENSVNEEGPWYSEDIYLCGNYYEHQQAK